jgi:hypothetical protein
MPKKKHLKVPFPTDEEVDRALSKGREIVAVAAKNKGRWLFLKLGFRTGDIATVCLMPHQADYLARALAHFLPVVERTSGSPSKFSIEEGEIQFGTMNVDV